MGPPRGKRDGVIGHILKRENENWIKKLRYCVIGQSGIQVDWENLAWTWILGNFLAWFVRKTYVKVGCQAPLWKPQLGAALKGSELKELLWGKWSLESVESKGPPKGASKSRFHAGFLHKSRLEITWNSCSRQIYPITLDVRLIYHVITQFFSFKFQFLCFEICPITPSCFPLGTLRL